MQSMYIELGRCFVNYGSENYKILYKYNEWRNSHYIIHDETLATIHSVSLKRLAVLEIVPAIVIVLVGGYAPVRNCVDNVFLMIDSKSTVISSGSCWQIGD